MKIFPLEYVFNDKLNAFIFIEYLRDFAGTILKPDLWNESMHLSIAWDSHMLSILSSDTSFSAKGIEIFKLCI